VAAVFSASRQSSTLAFVSVGTSNNVESPASRHGALYFQL
jgi:hypothetical protein